ncbi:hypothetical protein [Labilibaculum manganireducens]
MGNNRCDSLDSKDAGGLILKKNICRKSSLILFSNNEEGIQWARLDS